MKIGDNLDRHKISDKFEFRQDRTIHFEVTCPWVPKKKNTFEFVGSIACVTCLTCYSSFIKLIFWYDSL